MGKKGLRSTSLDHSKNITKAFMKGPKSAAVRIELYEKNEEYAKKTSS